MPWCETLVFLTPAASYSTSRSIQSAKLLRTVEKHTQHAKETSLRTRQLEVEEGRSGGDGGPHAHASPCRSRGRETIYGPLVGDLNKEQTCQLMRLSIRLVEHHRA